MVEVNDMQGDVAGPVSGQQRQKRDAVRAAHTHRPAPAGTVETAARSGESVIGSDSNPSGWNVRETDLYCVELD